MASHQNRVFSIACFETSSQKWGSRVFRTVWTINQIWNSIDLSKKGAGRQRSFPEYDLWIHHHAQLKRTALARCKTNFKMSFEVIFHRWEAKQRVFVRPWDEICMPENYQKKGFASFACIILCSFKSRFKILSREREKGSGEREEGGERERKILRRSTWLELGKHNQRNH